MPTTSELYRARAQNWKSIGSTTTVTTLLETFVGSLVRRTPAILARLRGFSSKAKGFLQGPSLSATFANTCRRLLFALLNVASPERRYLRRHPHALVPVYDLVNAGPRHRFCTANFVAHNCLGLGFGVGWRKFIDVARAMAGLELSETDSKRIVREFRTSNPLIVDLWDRLQAACEARDGQHYALPLPVTQHDQGAKRFLLYRDVAAVGDDITCTVGGERVYVYGGLLAENWTQATARDVLASAWLRCADAGFVPVLSVHDELVFELPAATAAADLEQILSIMEAPLPWAPHLPLKADGKLTPTYTK